MTNRIFVSLMIGCLFAAASSNFGQTPQGGTSQTSAPQSRIVGEVTAVDKTAHQVTIKSDTGESMIIITNEASSILRLPAGETSAQKAVRITLADIGVGERLFARGVVAAGGKSITASQVVLSSAAVSAGAAQNQGRQARARGLNGRITALNPEKKEISVQSRSREGVGTIVIQTSDGTRFFRYAPDSLDIKDASRSSFAGLKVGDQLRALGDTNEDGTRYTADEIISGLMSRTGGQVTAVNPSASEIIIKNNQTGQTTTVAIGSRSALHRVSAEDAASFEAGRPAQPARPDRPASSGSVPPNAAQPDRSRERRERPAGEESRPRAGRGFQEMIQNSPAIKVSDLKKGDTVFVSGTQGADSSHVTAIMLVTGDPAFIGRMLQTGPNRGPQNPGLPGDVLGGGVGNPERP